MTFTRRGARGVAGGFVLCGTLACSAGRAPDSNADLGGTGGGNANTGGTTSTSGSADGGSAPGTGGGTIVVGGTSNGGSSGMPSGASAGSGPMRDPETCDEAVKFRTYLGCEYFPTVLANVVYPDFDFAVVVANAGDEAAALHVDGPNGFAADASVDPHALATIFLPWVADLKGPNADGSCNSGKMSGSVLSRGGAYHLTSTRPVAAYQFSPLEFQAAGGPAGKTWACDASAICTCNSYANDASLLLPKNALTPNYFAFTWRDTGANATPSYIAVTAVEDATTVVVKVGAKGAVQAGPDGSGIAAAAAGSVFTLTLDAGDVAELLAVPGTDLAGTQVQSADTKPLQVMSGNAATRVPDAMTDSADHLEEIVFPAEAVGQDYVVTVPTGPRGMPVEHLVRLFGHAAESALSYFPAKPSGAPDTLEPGTVAEFVATSDFQVLGTTPFGVGSFLVGGALLDPATDPRDSMGDPSQSLVTSVVQYRDEYVFLAPVDYTKNYVDIVATSGTTVTLDGAALDPSSAVTLAGRAPDGAASQGFDIYREELGGTNHGQHELGATAPVGIQVTGYGRFTSYQYPGGLNLNLVSEPPPLPPEPK
ncbi:MAG TPA: IgGFc-binding protein [Polyangiaceae bacterium]|nr:IgGFc-binding protein [Polyangiaceae bacterium]